MAVKPQNPREIIDRRAFSARLDALLADVADPGAARAEVLGLAGEALAAGREVVRRRFEATHDGLEEVRGNCYLIDQILRVLYDTAQERMYPLANPTAGERLALVAVGGYGRGELAPGSDVDILFLLPYKATPHNEQVIEWLLYMLWDLGLKVGNATRTVDECVRLSRSDMTIRTALLEARYVWGDQPLYNELRQRFAADVVEGTGLQFVEAKLAERDERHRRMGDSRYVLEPNVKDGKGGLRDLQTLYWIAKYLYQVDDMDALISRGVFTAGEARKFAKALGFLWSVRSLLHYVAGRGEERLTFDLQPEVAERMGYRTRAGAQPVERFMKHYYLVAKDVGDLTRIFCAAMEAEHRAKPRLRLGNLLRRRRGVEGFIIEGGWLGVAEESVFAAEPVRLLRLFHFAQENDLDIQPTALRFVRRHLKRVDAALRKNPEANRLFLEMLTSANDPETTLRRLSEAGVLGRFIPDFGRVVAQTQHDMYHVYTVDEHTVRAIGLLHRIETGALEQDHPLSTEIVHKVLSRPVLYLAVLLHDIAKGRGGDHSVLGAEVAEKLCPRLGLNEWETETVAWLVRYHLAMSNTAQKRDIGDPKTIDDFVELVQSPERLRLLLVLTVVDMRATGPNVWNGWKAALLRELYSRAEEVMSGGMGLKAEQRVAAAQAALRDDLADWPEDRFAAHLARAHPVYWLGFDTATQARHARLVDRLVEEELPLALDVGVDAYRAVTEITLCAPDHPGLFAKMAGAIAVSGGNIVNARIHTLADGHALDTFWVQNRAGKAFDKDDGLDKLPALVERILAGRLDAKRILAGRRRLSRRAEKVFEIAPRVLIDNKASKTHTVVEVNGRDRAGLLYDVTRALTELGLQISAAKISTYGERVVDVFYVKDAFGMRIEHDGKLDRVRDALLAVLEEPKAVAAKSKGRAGVKKAAKAPKSAKPAEKAPKPAQKTPKSVKPPKKTAANKRLAG